MFIDTHAHLYVDKFDDDRDEMIQRAFKNGVERFYLPNIDSTTIAPMLEMEKDYPKHCFPMMGLHPCHVKENYKEELTIVKEWLDKRSFVAVGEIGVDLYWDKTFYDQQVEAFKIQLNWAKDLKKPIVIHCRESLDIVIDLVAKEKHPDVYGIFHCFGGTKEQAQKIIDLGFYLGIGGVVTFKKSGLDKTLEEISLDHIVLETDAPYLSPTPFRGKRNESAYIHQIATKIASIKEIGIEEVERKTTANAMNVFERKRSNSL